MKDKSFEQILAQASDESRTRVREYMDSLEEGLHLRQHGVTYCDRPIIFLTRDDLIHGKQDTPMNEIRPYDFRSKSISHQEFEEASMVIFEDLDGSYQFIKNSRDMGLTVINTETGISKTYL